MKRLASLLAVALLCATAGYGESVVATVSSTNQVAEQSAPINASGWLDRIEFVKNAATGICDIVVGTFDGTNRLETFVHLTDHAEATTRFVLRPRQVGTLLTATTALSAATTTYLTQEAAGTNGVVTTVLNVPFDRMMLGGNTKLYVRADTNGYVKVTATIFYERTPR